MIVETKDVADQSMGALVGGIVSDAQLLVKQHLDLFRQEVRADLAKSKRVAIAMATAAMLAMIGCIFVGAMLVGLLAWAMPDVPWWGWCGIVGGTMLILAAVVYGSAKRLIASLNLMPDQTVRAIKEDFQWPNKQQTT